MNGGYMDLVSTSINYDKSRVSCDRTFLKGRH